MPNALRVYTSLKGAGVQDDHALAVAAIVATARTPGSLYDEEALCDVLCEAGFAEALAEAVCRTVANCFPSERFARTFNAVQLKTNLVRGGWTAPVAVALIEAVTPCVTTPRPNEVRAPVKYVPSPGRVVMCDFSHLQRPEMQKERRAIVVSTQAASGAGRCTVVPVSKTRSREGNPHHHLFPPNSYPFFHATDPVWAVCDHLYTVSLTRLWQINVRDKPSLPSISDADFSAIKRLIGTSVGV